MIKIFEVSGTDYEMGFEIGRRFKSFLDKVMPSIQSRVNENRDRIAHIEYLLKNSMPNCLAEIFGRADGAGASREAMLFYMFPEICGGIDGCTTVALKKRGSVLFAHNEDDVGFIGEDVALVKYRYKDGFVFAYTMASRMAGSAFAFNSSGMAFSSNNIYGGRSAPDNISRYIALRDIINSKSLNEVRQKLGAVEVASPFSLNALDVNTLEVSNFEKDIVGVTETAITDRYARSNHFLTVPSVNSAAVPNSSIFRYEKSKELMNLLDEGSGIDDLVDILEYEGDNFDTSIYEDRQKYPGKLCTVATFAVDASAGTYVVYDRIYGDKLVFDASARLVSAERCAKISKEY